MKGENEMDVMAEYMSVDSLIRLYEDGIATELGNGTIVGFHKEEQED